MIYFLYQSDFPLVVLSSCHEEINVLPVIRGVSVSLILDGVQDIFGKYFPGKV